MALPPTQEIVAFLRASEAFSGTPEPDLSALAERFVEKPVSAGETVVEEDADGGEVYLVLDGLFQVSTIADDGEERQIRLLQRGDVFGEIAAMTGGRRMATVRADGNGMLLALGEEDFQSVLQNSPEMVESICASLARYFESD